MTMNKPIKTLSILTAVAAVAVIADAQVKERNARPERKPAGFNCPVCNSPCISKADAMRQRRQIHAKRQAGMDRPAHARRNPGIHSRQRRPQPPEAAAQARKQKSMRFDFDGNGELSPAERAALKAYRAELKKERGSGPVDQPPVGE
jgi:hypothetical protein